MRQVSASNSLVIAKITLLRGEISSLRKTIDPSEHELQLAVRRARRILGNHVPAQPRLHPRKTSLGMRGSHSPSASQRAQ